MEKWKLEVDDGPTKSTFFLQAENFTEAWEIAKKFLPNTKATYRMSCWERDGKAVSSPVTKSHPVPLPEKADVPTVTIILAPIEKMILRREDIG